MATINEPLNSQGLLRAHRLRIALVVILVVLTIQGWFGDTVNLFVVPANGIAVTPSFSGLLQAIFNGQFLLIWHAFEGAFLVIFSFALLGLSFAWSKKRSVRIMSILGTFMVVSAALGGVLFVLSGFANGGNSAQMGGSFIGAYAFYFMELYFAK